jgi:hypothetical protein
MVSMRRVLLTLAAAALAAGCEGEPAPEPVERPRRYEELTALFTEWRAFQRPPMLEGAADYSAATMTAQHEALARWIQRLASFDTTGWTIPQQVDYHIVRAEMNGLDFDHRVLKPWTNNPAFYVTFFPSESDQPAREGPFAYGAVELWSYQRPFSDADAARLDSGLRAIPPLLAQARINLTGTQADLWAWGTRSIRDQASELATFITELAEGPAGLKASAEAARAATDEFATWLDAQKAQKTGPSGIGREHYDWLLKNVLLLPYSHRDEVVLMERELWRSYAYLALEEKRNTGVAAPSIVGSEQEHARRFNGAVSEYMAFLRDRGLITVREYMELRLRERIGRYNPGKREFFGEVDYRDPQIMRTHGFHWFDKGAMAEGYGNPIRNGALLYNIFTSRTEGLATGWEEMMMGAGMFDRRPRSRELIYVLLAERAARALGDLRMHANEWSLDQASKFASENTPRGWLGLDGNLVWFEQHLYLQQPGYGVSYVIGKIEIERLIAARMRQLGDRFSLQAFMDELTAAGQIPISLIRWQMTGELTDDLKRMLEQ